MVRYLEIGGRRLSRIGLGCWQFGERGWGYGKEYGEEQAFAVIARALELGLNVFDTAELYGWGTSEQLVGAALAGRREEVFLATKFLPLLPLPGQMVSHLQRSLGRLQTGKVDLYQLHFPNPTVSLRLQARGLRTVLRLGMTGEVGVSNYSLGAWKRIERYLGQPVISNQVRYNLLQRKPEREMLSFAEEKGRVILAYSPLAQGALSGRYRPGLRPEGVRRSNLLFSDQALEAARPLIELLQELGTAHRASPAQIALAYLVNQPQVIAIPGAKSVEQLEANCAAADIELPAEEVLALRRAADLVQFSRLRALTRVLPQRAGEAA